jgi:hypothetical protein
VFLLPKIPFTNIHNMLYYICHKTGIKMNIEKIKDSKTFRIGAVFGHRVSGLVPQYHGKSFKDFLKPSKNKIITIPLSMSKLVDYVLPKNMNDTEIQNATKSTPMDEDIFWAVLYLLIIEPELGKQLLGYELTESYFYIFHVIMVNGNVRTVRVHLRGEWLCFALAFDDEGIPWSQGCVFVHFATV